MASRVLTPARRRVTPGSRTGPILGEALRGIAGSGTAHTDWLLYLFWQAVVLFVWWPKDSLLETLDAGARPNTLLASLVALGVACAWYAARAGAEDLLLPGQAGLAQWTADTTLAPGRILAGYLLGHLCQTLGLVAVSLPLVLCGFSVSGGEWSALGWSLTAVVFQATFFRLVAAVLLLAIGRNQRTMTRECARSVVVAGYLAGLLALPAVSHVAVTAALLAGPAPAVGLSHPGVVFLLWSTLGTAAAALVLYRQMTRLRRAHTAAAG